MWGEVLDWLLSMAHDLVHGEPLSLKPLYQLVVMTEMPPPYYPPLDVTQPHNPVGDVQKKILLPTVAARSNLLWLF